MTNRDYLSKVGMELKVARIRKGLTTTELGKLTGICHKTIGQLERGKNDAKILTYKRVADALKVELKEFF